MEGLEVTELDIKNILKDNDVFRLDSEYFSKQNLKLLSFIKKNKFKEIGTFANVTDGIHTAIDYSYTSGINLISATSPKQNYFDLSRKVYISEKAHLENPRTALKENDIIISTVGTIGNCAVVNKSILPANSDRHVGIIRVKKDFSPYYISTFLLTKFGKFQSIRESTGNVQLNLFIIKLKKLKIPFLSIDFQNKIESLVLKANEHLEKSKETFFDVERKLLEYVGLKNFVFNKDKINIVNLLNSFSKTGRLDAEYYQPKYEEIVKHIENQNHDFLVNLVKIKKSIEPGSDYYSDVGMPFLRVADYNKFGLSVPDKNLSYEFCEENSELLDSLKPKKGTILFSKDGSVGNAYLLRQNLEAVTSGAILNLKIKDPEKIIPEYLTLVLNSLIVKMQAERDAGGSIILHWKVKEIENVLIPIIDLKKQREIAVVVEDSFCLKKESEKLLDLAKKAVEIAIERSEKEALKFIKENEKL